MKHMNVQTDQVLSVVHINARYDTITKHMNIHTDQLLSVVQINARYDTITASPFRLHIVLAGFLVAQVSPYTLVLVYMSALSFPSTTPE